MASVEFLEEALNTNVDESAVNAIVGSLENQLVTSSAEHTNNNQTNIHKILSNGNIIMQNQVSSPVTMEISKVTSSPTTFIPNSPQVITSTMGQMQGRVNYIQNANTQGLTLVTKGQTHTSSGQATVLSNRVIYPATSLPNRSIAIAPISHNVIQTVAGNKSVQIQSPLIIKQGVNQVVRPGLVTVPMTNAAMGTALVELVNKNMGQNMGSQTLVGPGGTNVQIVNMRPGAPQKNMGPVSPRVVIATPQVRPTGPGITLQALQGFQAGHQGHLLLKTENGQLQLLRVGPGPSAPGGQSIRLATVTPPQQVTNLSNAQQSMQPTTLIQQQQPMQQTTIVSVAPQQQLQVRPQAVVAAAAAINQKTSVDNLKEKCRKFLSNLLDLSSKEPKSVERNVRILIQELIDAKVEPEIFCERLEKLLDASPQPCLIGFLKKTLPILRQSLVNKELVIEGIHPPPLSVVYSCATPALPTPTVTQQPVPPLQAQVRPILQTSMAAPPVPTTATTKTTSSLRQVTKLQSQTKTLIKVASNVPSSLGTSLSKQAAKEKEKKTASSSFSQAAFTEVDKMGADDDINDVAAMGGVNLAEESQKILRSTEMIGTQIRSCKDEYLASMGPLQARLKQIAIKHGLEEPSFDVAALISHALQERLKNIVEKLGCIAEHRLDIIKLMPNYEVTQDVKGQLKFLEDLDRVERKKRDEYEREILLRAAKSRSKNEDPEQAKLKEKAKEMQRAEMEEMRQRDANLTALQALGPRKKFKSNNPNESGSSDVNMTDISTVSKNGMARTPAPLRTRMKRVNYRDLLFLLEQERDTVRSHMLYKCYLK